MEIRKCSFRNETIPLVRETVHATPKPMKFSLDDSDSDPGFLLVGFSLAKRTRQ